MSFFCYLRRKTNKQIKTQTYCACVRCNLATLHHCATLPGRSTWGSGTIDPQDRDRCFAFVWVLFVLEPRIRSLDARTGMYSTMCINVNLFALSSIINLSAFIFKFWDWWWWWCGPVRVLCSQWPRGVEEAKIKQSASGHPGTKPLCSSQCPPA